MKTREQALASVTEKIVKAVPEIASMYCDDCGTGGYLPTVEQCHCGCMRFAKRAEREPTLEDVLKLDFQGQFVSIDQNGDFYLDAGCGGWDMQEESVGWALGKPLSEQSDECIVFLDSLLNGN